jgi:hypothetical protein
MSIRRYGASITFECDECGDALETRCTTVTAAKAEKSEAGWRSERRGEGWVDLCPGCLESQA